MSTELSRDGTTTPISPEAAATLPVEVIPRRLPIRRPPSGLPAVRTRPGLPATAFDSGSRMPALRQVGTPRTARKVGVVLMLVFVALPFVLVMVPWRQSVFGDGKVIGLHPLDREFMVTSPISGRVREFYVNEGDRVEVGDPIASVENVDTQYLDTLKAQLRLSEQQRDLAEQTAVAYESALRQKEAERKEAIAEADAAVRMAEQKISEADQKVAEAQTDTSGYKILYEQAKTLYERGLEAGQNVLKAEQIYRATEQKLRQAEAILEQARHDLDVYRAKRQVVEAKAVAEIEKARTDVQNANVKIQDYANKIQDTQVSIRQQEQGGRVVAPRDGTVLRLMTNVGAGAQVKEGDSLAILIPETPQLAAEIYLPGRDIPLVQAGDPVRLQFEGWPALQFIGWPAAAVGTFPARVILVDSTETRAGRFRVLAVPDMDGPELNFEALEGGSFQRGTVVQGLTSGATAKVLSSELDRDDRGRGTLTIEGISGEFLVNEPIVDGRGVRASVRSPWPSREFLRQGARANGWVLLREVPLGFEIWRRLNGFAPVVAEKEPSSKDGDGGGKDDKPKVKRPK